MAAIIPRNIQVFNIYIRKTNAYLLAGTPANYIRFNWTAANLLAWQDIETEWVPLYAQYTDKRGQRTTAVTEQLYLIINKAAAYDKANRLIILIKATLNLNALDCVTFNFSLANTGSSAFTHHVSEFRKRATAQLVYPKLKPYGGGTVGCKCYVESTASGKAGKLTGFDMVEFAWAVFSPTDDNLPVDANDVRLTKGRSTRASFLLATGTNNTYKVLIIFLRWAKSKNPALDGPWNGPFNTPVL